MVRSEASAAMREPFAVIHESLQMAIIYQGTVGGSPVDAEASSPRRVAGAFKQRLISVGAAEPNVSDLHSWEDTSQLDMRVDGRNLVAVWSPLIITAQVGSASTSLFLMRWPQPTSCAPRCSKVELPTPTSPRCSAAESYPPGSSRLARCSFGTVRSSPF